MWIGQYMQGRLAENLYSADKNTIQYFNPVLFLESVVMDFGFDYWIVEILFRIIFFLLYLIMLQKFVVVYLSGQDGELTVYIIALFVSPFAFFVAEITPFSAAYLTSTMAAHLFLQIAVFYLALQKWSLTNGVLLFASLVLLFLSHPYSITYLPVVLIGYLLLANKDGSNTPMIACAISAVLFSVLLFVFQTGSSNQHMAWLAGRFPEAMVLLIFIGLLPFSITAVYGMKNIARALNRNPDLLLLEIWAIAVFALIFFFSLFPGVNLPLQPPKIAIGLLAPLVLLTFRNSGILQFVRKFRFAIFIILFSSIALFSLAQIAPRDDQYTYLNIDVVRAFEKIGADGDARIVLSSHKNSVISPFYTRKPSYPGHESLTSDFLFKKQVSKQIIDGGDLEVATDFCNLNAGGHILTEQGENLYGILQQNKSGMAVEFVGDAAILSCDG
jgi:hypothetical protein